MADLTLAEIQTPNPDHSKRTQIQGVINKLRGLGETYKESLTGMSVILLADALERVVRHHLLTVRKFNGGNEITICEGCGELVGKDEYELCQEMDQIYRALFQK